MIEFVTLFLGLSVGYQSLELLAGPEVARVEIRLDDEKIQELRSPPWRTAIDLGPILQPHELSAIAFDRTGRESGRARQWINRPRPAAEAALVLEGGLSGRGRRARVTWHATAGPSPTKWTVTFDGMRLAVEDPRSFELPAHVPEQVHFLRVELEFRRNVTAVSEVFFGGKNKDETQAELTAVPVVLTAGKKLPPLAALDRLFVEGVKPLHVVAAEEGPSEVVVVLDGSADSFLANLGKEALFSGQRRMRFGTDQRTRIVWPTPEKREHSGFVHQVFPMSEDLGGADGGLLWLLNHVRRVPDVPRQRLAEAVAVGAVSVAGRNRRRAVVLVLGDHPRDRSDIPTAEVKRYLERLGVPLFVWSVVPQERRLRSLDWGDVVDASTRRLMARAVDHVIESLKRQRIVWVEGRVPPQNIVIAGRPDFIALAGSPVTPVAEPFNEASEEEETPYIVAGEGEVVVPAGSRLRKEADPLSDTLTVVDTGVALRVLERNDTWFKVAYESWKGWVQPGDEGDIASLEEEDPARAARNNARELRRARSFLGPVLSGVWTLAHGRAFVYTDVRDGPLLTDLANALLRFEPVYERRYGVSIALQKGHGWVTDPKSSFSAVLFAREASWREYTGPEPEGLADHGFGVLVREGRDGDTMRREFTRSAVRQWNHSKLHLRLPPWLDEGLAGDLALSDAPDGGASLRLVREAGKAGKFQRLSTLAGYSRAQFFAPDLRDLNVALSAFLIRYLVEADGGAHAVRFRGFLRDLQADAPPRADILLENLGLDWESLQLLFDAWIGKLP